MIVEGVFDALQEPNMIPLLGSSMSERSILFQTLADKMPKVYMALDPDARQKENKIISNLLRYGLDVWKIPISGSKDVGGLSGREYQIAKEFAVQTGFDYELYNL